MRVLVYIFLPLLFLTSTLFNDNYYFHYCSLIATLLACMYCAKDINSKIMLYFIFGYYGISLLNISNYRGLITDTGMYAFNLYLGAFVITNLLFSAKISSALPSFTRVRATKTGTFQLFMLTHVAISYATLALVMVTTGNIFLNQDLRFNIPAWMGYIIRSPLPIIPILYFLPYSQRRKFCIVAMISLPSILIGARGTVVSFVASYALLLTINLINNRRNRETIKRSVFRSKKFLKIFGGSFLAFFVTIASGFYIRRYNSQVWSSAGDMAREYFQSESIFVFIILPFYLAFKETTGLANQIINNNLALTSNIFFSDFYTLLPGSHDAAGKIFGDEVGRIGGGGLTPGIVGGLFLDYKYYGVLGMIILATALSRSYAATVKHPKYAAVYAILIFQFIHLFHRGFPKPEYVTFTIIALFYTAFFLRKNHA
ncbi:hypothetical protein D3C81_1203540 [compost metagenome]